jgi:hypothetical protein
MDAPVGAGQHLRMCQGGMLHTVGCISAAQARVESFRKHADRFCRSSGKQPSVSNTKKACDDPFVTG